MVSTRQMAELYGILADLHFLYDSEKIYTCLLESLMKTVDADAASLFMANPKEQSLTLRACIGPKKKMLDLISDQVPFPFSKGICGWVAKHNQPLSVDNVQKDERFNSQVDTLTGYKTKSVICAPVSGKNKVAGVIEVLNKKAAAFNQDDQDVISLIGKQASIALQNAKLYAEINTTHEFSNGIFSNLTGGFIAIDSNEVVTHLNPLAERILQLDAAKVVGKNCDEAFGDYPLFHVELVQTMRDGRKKVRKEVRCKKRDKSMMTLGYSTFSIQNKSKKVLGAGMIFQDLTKFK